jgi:CheY-like chemotaxis protein
VDDNPTNRRILEELLANWGTKPTLAEDASTALEYLTEAVNASRPFALVLLDSRMPLVDGFTLAAQIRSDPRLAATGIVMLTSSGQRGDATRCANLGVAAFLTKPVGQSELLEVILQVLGTRGPQADRPSPVTPCLSEHSQPLHFLLAEDNPVNRKVAVGLLEKLGHAVDVATDGREALEKLELADFDLVLMDVQMPEMDGFEATAAIREMEKAKGGHIPILAMTAHAMKGDRERCLAAGMDGYIAKPVRGDDLVKEIDRVFRQPGAGQPTR